jgi:DNA-binding NarL/FixJ family response regulator
MAKQKRTGEGVMLKVALIESDTTCRAALQMGLESTCGIKVSYASAEAATLISACRRQPSDVVWLECNPATQPECLNTVSALRACYPQLPILLYLSHMDDVCLRACLAANLSTHYALVLRTIYRLPAQYLAIMRNLCLGRTFLEPEVARYLPTVRFRHAHSPLRLLSSREKQIVAQIAHGMANAQIAHALGVKDAREVSRLNGDIYASLGLPLMGADEKVARTRTTLMYLSDLVLHWDDVGKPVYLEPDGRTMSRWR